MTSELATPTQPWLGAEGSFVLDGVEFVLDMGMSQDRRRSQNGSFTLVKNEEYLKLYEPIRQNNVVNNIVEVGIFQGGGTAYLDRYFEPNNLLAIEISQDRIAPLDDYVERWNRSESVHLCYGTSQSDTAAIDAAIHSAFGTDLIDLVVDDGSHNYHHTKATFDHLFPLLSPGGVYVIEDWAWGHGQGRYDEPEHPWFNQPSLTTLGMELMCHLGSSGRLISKLEILPPAIIVHRNQVRHLGTEQPVSEMHALRPGRSLCDI